MDGLFLLLGSNIPDQEFYLKEALRRLTLHFGSPMRISSLYKTEPWGIRNQGWFLNQVAVFDIPVQKPAQILDSIKRIETDMGRRKTKKWGPREIDIDILYLADQIVESSDVTIPHPQIQFRRFTLVPLTEVAADGIHPILNKSNILLLQECEDDSEVELYVNSDTTCL